eukprot:7861144-Prorocentrum_lima.AAC.1
MFSPSRSFTVNHCWIVGVESSGFSNKFLATRPVVRVEWDATHVSLAIFSTTYMAAYGQY